MSPGSSAESYPAFAPIGARGLKLLSLNVPPTADIFQPVTMSCEYDLEGGNLYSVKWYKDDCEFFRFMPDYEPKSQAFHTPGISLDLQKSDINRVTLINLHFNTSGNYKCEVSTEAPNFVTVAQSSNMTVMVDQGEWIRGQNVNCHGDAIRTQELQR
ncbi:hypothetical protein ANN_01352 [Periplaneta americana]|uniref:Ig-like domain-containing protein n=1 Tax=Periplaneta americana TaxID=6978 RepID=A0ABQ8TWC0_PERAM|nr:hypothetical protein ANN_01352 [Periplaneta americana]